MHLTLSTPRGPSSFSLMASRQILAVASLRVKAEHLSAELDQLCPDWVSRGGDSPAEIARRAPWVDADATAQKLWNQLQDLEDHLLGQALSDKAA